MSFPFVKLDFIILFLFLLIPNVLIIGVGLIDPVFVSLYKLTFPLITGALKNSLASDNAVVALSS